MKVIGLTGGVGSGKSKILELLQECWQAEVIQADLVAKALEEPGEPGYRGLVEALGTGILADTGALDRSRLAKWMFGDEEIRQKVNQVIHPLTWSRIHELIGAGGRELMVVEAALLDSKADDVYDEVWYVYTSEPIRVRRLTGTRGYSLEQSAAMMASQPSDAEYRQRADFVIDNNGTADAVIRQLETKLGKVINTNGVRVDEERA